MSVGALYVRDETSRRLLGKIGAFQQYQANLAWNDAGTWSLSVAAGSNAAPLLRAGTGVVAVRGGRTWGGPIDNLQLKRAAGGLVVFASGKTDEILLHDRLTLPDPAGNFASSEFDSRSGAAETIMHAYVAANAGPAASIAARAVVGLSMGVDLGRGASVEQRARFEPLDDVLRDVATKSYAAGGDEIGWRVVPDGDVGLIFETYVGADLSAAVVLSFRMGNLRSHDYNVQAPGATFVWAGGQGDGTARPFDDGEDTAAEATWGRRIESFLDDSSATSAGELAEPIAAELAKQGARFTLQAEQNPTASFAPGDDYWLGDTITVEVEGEAVAQKVREMQVSWTRQGETVQPVLATPERPSHQPSNPFVPIFARVRSLRRDVDRLQAR